MNKHQEALDKLAYILEIYSIDIDDKDIKKIKDCLNILGELVNQTKTPTLEEVLKECEDDGWKWYFSKQKESVLFLTNSIKHISIIIDIEEKNYHKTCSWDYSEYLPLSYQEHNLVSKIFRALD